MPDGSIATVARQQRAYSLLTIKSVNDEQRVLTGIATTPETDRVGDVVESKGAQFKLPLPLLYQHNSKQPIGHVTQAKATNDGIEITARVAKDVPVEFIEEAWQLIKAGLVRGLSIGFSPIEYSFMKEGGIHFTKVEIYEVSAVTIPANASASIQTIKSLDKDQLRAASGASQSRPIVRLAHSPVVTGSSNLKGITVKTIAEQLASFEAKRAASVGRMDTIMSKSGEEGRTLDETETQEYDGLAAEVKAVDEHIGRLKTHEAAMVAKAVPITTGNGIDHDVAGSNARSGVVVMGKSNLPPGVRFTRFAMCQAQAKGNLMQAEVLSRRFTDTPEVNMACKAAVAAGTTQDTTWAAPLVQLQEMQSEFVEFLRPQTLLGRIPNIRRVPFNIKFTRQTAGTTGTFVGEGLAKPVGKMDFELLSMTWAKAATIIVMTDELVRFSNPNSEVLARDDLAAGIARYLDLRFIDPVYAGVANVSPASITNGVSPIASLGTTIALITDTVEAALASMITADLNLGGLVWVMNPGTALSLSLKRTSQDVFAFPGLGPTGGTFFGYPVITSRNVALSGSPTESFVVLMDPSEIMLADDGAVSIDMSNEASLQMDSAPSAGAQSLVSLWQNNMVALRAERYINWRKRRDAAVAVITMNASW